MSTTGAASAPPEPAGRIPASCCPRRAPGRLIDQAVAAGHPPGVDRRRLLAGVHGRVCVSVQPPPLTQPRHDLLSGARGWVACLASPTGRHGWGPVGLLVDD